MTEEGIAGTGSGAARRRWSVPTIVLAACAILVAATTCGVFWHVSASYQPLRAAGWYGPQPGRPMHVVWANNDNDHLLLGPTGTEQDFEWAMVNDGSHAVTITRMDPVQSRLDGLPVITSVSWAPYREQVGGLVNGYPTRSRPFPAHLPEGSQIKIRFTVRKPACQTSGAGGYLSVAPLIRVHWHAMISSHTTVLSPAFSDYRIILCGH